MVQGYKTITPTKEAWLDKANPDTNNDYPASTGLYLSGGSAGSPNAVKRILMSFDLLTLPTGLSGFALLTAGVYIDRLAASPSAARQVNAYKCTQLIWVEAEVTWNSYSTGNTWVAAGGDYVTSNPAGCLHGSQSQDPLVFGTGCVDVVTLLQDAIDNSLAALNLLIRCNREGTLFDVVTTSYEGNGISETGTTRLYITYSYEEAPAPRAKFIPKTIFIN